MIDVIGLHPEPNLFLKLPFAHSKPKTGTALKPASPATAVNGDLFVSEHTTVKELAGLLGLKAFQIIADAMELGIFANVNQPLDFEAISQIAGKYGYSAKRKA